VENNPCFPGRFCFACGTKKEKAPFFRTGWVAGLFSGLWINSVGFFSRWEGRFGFKGLERRMSTPAASQ
jgi:hypothetical protein